jgi:hypothetical protein
LPRAGPEDVRNDAAVIASYRGFEDRAIQRSRATHHRTGGDMTESVHDIAERLRAVADDRTLFQQTLASLFADAVELHHEPARPTDGPIPGRLIAEVSRLETEAAGRALSTSLESRTEIVVDGHAVRVIGSVAGTLADGTAIDVHTNVDFTIADGKIVGLRSDMDEASTTNWGRVLAAGGFAIPEELIAALAPAPTD